MTSIPERIRNIAVLFSPITIPENTRSPGSFYPKNSLGAQFLFFQVAKFQLGSLAENFWWFGWANLEYKITSLSYKMQSPIDILTADNTTRALESSQPLPSNARPHQVPHRLPLPQTMERQYLPHPAPVCQSGNLSKPCTSQKQGWPSLRTLDPLKNPKPTLAAPSKDENEPFKILCLRTWEIPHHSLVVFERIKDRGKCMKRCHYYLERKGQVILRCEHGAREKCFERSERCRWYISCRMVFVL